MSWYYSLVDVQVSMRSKNNIIIYLDPADFDQGYV